MKLRIDAKQQQMLLMRRANQKCSAQNPQPQSYIRQAILEVLAGLVLGLPLGASCYYIIVAVLYYPIMLCLILASESSTQFLNFSPLVDIVLAVSAVAFILYFTHGAIRQGYRVFAWVQLPLSLPIVLAAFYWTTLLHRPILPFAGP